MAMGNALLKSMGKAASKRLEMQREGIVSAQIPGSTGD